MVEVASDEEPQSEEEPESKPNAADGELDDAEIKCFFSRCHEKC